MPAFPWASMRFVALLVHDYIQARGESAPVMDFLKMKALSVAGNNHEDYGSITDHAGSSRKEDADRAVGEDDG